MPSGRNFGLKTQKGPGKIVWGREKSAGEFLWQIYQKKGPNFSVVGFCTLQQLYFGRKLSFLIDITQFFPTILHCESWKYHQY
jgi:hypothetical protein